MTQKDRLNLAYRNSLNIVVSITTLLDHEEIFKQPEVMKEELNKILCNANEIVRNV